MKKTTFLALAFVLLFFTSCAKHIYVDYQNEATNTGKVILKPSKPTQRTYVTINDSLVVDKKFAKSVTLVNVPEGDYVVNFTSENGWYKEKLNAELPVSMESGREKTKLIEVPPYGTGYWVYLSATALLSALLSFAI